MDAMLRQTLDEYAHAMAKLCNDHTAEKRRIAARIRKACAKGVDRPVSIDRLATLLQDMRALAAELEGK